MKLGISYNIFDCEELLEDSIRNIREVADYISIVYQEISNHGNKCSDELLPLIEYLKNEGVVDEVFKYKPNCKGGPDLNEIKKRKIVISGSEGSNCTNHMSMGIN